MSMVSIDIISQELLTLYVVLGCWWVITLWERKWNILNIDRLFVIFFFGHCVVWGILYAIWMTVCLLQDLTPTRLKTWLFEEWK